MPRQCATISPPTVQDGTNIGRATTTYVWGNGRLVDGWPAAPDENEYSQMRTSNVEALLIGGELDFSTPPQIAGETAKIFLGLALALAALTVRSLVWMARRVHKRDHIGSKASAALRSAYPIVLGLGGWFLGALIALATMRSVPIDDELLVALSVGLPVGLGNLPGLGAPRLDSPEQGCRRRGSGRRCARRRLAWVPRHARPDRTCHRDPRGRRRRQPRADPARHGAGRVDR
jgi:hypothetical protein